MVAPFLWAILSGIFVALAMVPPQTEFDPAIWGLAAFFGVGAIVLAIQDEKC